MLAQLKLLSGLRKKWRIQMSKYVKITPEILKTVVQEFSDAIKDSKFPDGKITFSKTITQTDRKASLFFTDIAWAKMNVNGKFI